MQHEASEGARLAGGRGEEDARGTLLANPAGVESPRGIQLQQALLWRKWHGLRSLPALASLHRPPPRLCVFLYSSSKLPSARLGPLLLLARHRKHLRQASAAQDRSGKPRRVHFRFRFLALSVQEVYQALQFLCDSALPPLEASLGYVIAELRVSHGKSPAKKAHLSLQLVQRLGRDGAGQQQPVCLVHQEQSGALPGHQGVDALSPRAQLL
mmetsp:Transcript_11681/g.43531  ORF Transcript_11681/g.43531 Transcript_11681/m.43531 type:complete len:212 (-) Transcript_11681:321-956(-)